MAKRGRKRLDLGPDEDARVAAMVARGVPTEAIATALGTSLTTAKRRVAAVRAGVQAAKGVSKRAHLQAAMSAAAPAALEADDGDVTGEGDDVDGGVGVPAGASLEQVDKWLARIEEKARLAETSNDDDAYMKYARLVVVLLDAKRKLAPPPPVDPNANPDLIEAARQVRERWAATIKGMAEHG